MVRRPALAVVVEHASAEAGFPVLDPAVLDRNDGRAPRVLHVDPSVAAVAARVAVVVPELRLRDERKDEPRDGFLLVAARLGREERRAEAGEKCGDESRSGCRPVASHCDVALRFALEGPDGTKGQPKTSARLAHSVRVPSDTAWMGGLVRASARWTTTAETGFRARAVRIGVLLIVAVVAFSAAVSLLDGARDLTRMADVHASLTHLDLEYGALGGSPNAIRDPVAIERAVALIPPRATYAVVVDPRWVPVRRPKWTTSLERDFLRYHLYPRAQVEPSAAAWMFCLGCDANAFPSWRPRAKTSDGIYVLERR